jgi:hypothetical protein
MKLRIFLSVFLLLSIACMSPNEPGLILQIILPRSVEPIDTIHTPYIPVEGNTTFGATLRVSLTASDSGTLIVPDASGHFIGKVIIPDDENTYATFFTVKMDTRMIKESRWVYYKRLP